MSLKKPKIMALHRKMIMQKYFGITLTWNISDWERLGLLHTNIIINRISVSAAVPKDWLLQETVAPPALGLGWRPESWSLSPSPPSAGKYFSTICEIKKPLLKLLNLNKTYFNHQSPNVPVYIVACHNLHLFVCL